MSQVITAGDIDFRLDTNNPDSIIISSSSGEFAAIEMPFDTFIVAAAFVVRENKINRINLMSDREVLGLAS